MFIFYGCREGCHSIRKEVFALSVPSMHVSLSLEIFLCLCPDELAGQSSEDCSGVG